MKYRWRTKFQISRGINYIRRTSGKTYNVEKIAERNAGTKMRMRRNLINQASSLFLRTRRASSMMEKCAREHISEVVPLSSSSLKKKKNRAPAGSRETFQDVEKIWMELPKEWEDLFVNGREVRSFSSHTLCLSFFPRGLITLIASAMDPIAGTKMEEVLENFIQKSHAPAAGPSRRRW